MVSAITHIAAIIVIVTICYLEFTGFTGCPFINFHVEYGAKLLVDKGEISFCGVFFLAETVMLIVRQSH